MLKTQLRYGFNKIDPVLRGVIYFFLDSSLTGVFYFFSLYFHAVLGYPVDQAALLISAYGLGAILGGMAGGRVSDWISPSGISFFSCLIYGILFFIFQKVTASYFLFPIIFLMGFFSNVFITANNIFILELASGSDNAKTRAQSLSSISSNLGLAGSALLASLLIPFGYDHLFWVVDIGIFGLAFLIGLDWYSEKKIKAHKKINEIGNVYQLFNSDFIKLFIALFFVGVVIAQMSSTYSVYLHDQFPLYGAQLFSYLFILNTLIVVVFQHPVTILFESVHPLKCIGLSGIFFVLGFLILVFEHTLFYLAAAMIFYTLGEILFFTFSRVYCYDLAPDNQKGLALGLYRSIYAGSRVLGVYFGGLIYHFKGGFSLFLFCAMCALAPLSIPLFSQNKRI